MMPRKQLDIGWADLAAGLGSCLGAARVRPVDGTLLTRRRDGLVCLSVRSGLDLLLAELAWPAGTEVLVSAITIPDISRILREHGLVPVAVDLDPGTLLADAAAWERARSPRTKAVLVAHLFGGRLPLDELIAWARARGLQVWEDCAQAFAGDGWTGHAESDVRMFSFGPIKTATALGGGVVLVRDPDLLARLQQRHAGWPQQSNAAFLRRIAKFAAVKPLLTAPGYTLWVTVLRFLRRNHDDVVTTFGRGFAGGDFFQKLRHRPSDALVALLERRLMRYDPQRVRDRAAAGAELQRQLTAIRLLGAATPGMTYWLFPVRVAQRTALVKALWAEGIDATIAASSLHALPGAPRAEQAMAEILYVPAYPAMGSRRLARVARCLNALAQPPR